MLESIPEKERSKEIKSLDLNHDHLPIERALGVQWAIESDELGFKITLNDRPLTRRGVLSTISSIYDPLGMAAPSLLPGKKILQDLCRENLDWDDDLPDEYPSRWEKWRAALPRLEQFSVARCLKSKNFGSVVSKQVHSFSDASLIGYGQVSYLRQVNDKGEIFCAFLMGKSRLTPLKPVTIPRLELTAAVLSAKIGSMMKEELEISEDIYWTDSTTVIKYVNNEQARFQTFVANRVQAIRDRTKVDQWKYVDSKDNPADDISRGMEIDNFLSQQSPIPDVCSLIVEGGDILQRFEYFSQWHRMKKVISWLLRLTSACKATTKRNDNSIKKPSTDQPRPITVSEMERAEIAILKLVQKQAFSAEIAALETVMAENHKDVREDRNQENQLPISTGPLRRRERFTACRR